MDIKEIQKEQCILVLCENYGINVEKSFMKAMDDIESRLTAGNY